MPNILRVRWLRHAPFGKIFTTPARLSKDKAICQIWSP